jgi:hypothetical protein
VNSVAKGDKKTIDRLTQISGYINQSSTTRELMTQCLTFGAFFSMWEEKYMKNFFAGAATVVVLLAWASNLIYGQSDVETRAAETSQALVNGHVAWKTKLSSPGASVQVKEVSRQGSLVQYHLYVSGLPSNELYTAVSWPVTQAKPSPVMEGVSLGKDGIVMCAGRTPEQCGDSSKKDDPIEFTFKAAKGEPYRLALVAGDNKVAVVIVPDPILAKDKGCALSVERLLPHFELAFFTGSGFPPNSDVSFDGQSYDEKHPISTKTDSEGNLHFALMPFVTGHHKGSATIKGVGTTCSPSIKFEWGS